jgi:hypothetical protein
MNFLFQGDKGYRISDMFRAFEQADLEFISMTNWREWEVLDLFKDADNLPLPLALGLPEASAEERLKLYELLHPVYRLLDFWCGQPQPGEQELVSTWSEAEWQNATVHWHPVLRTDAVRDALIDAARKPSPLVLTQFLNQTVGKKSEMILDGTMVSVLLALWEGGQPFTALVQRYAQIRPLDPVTLEPIRPEAAFQAVQEFLTQLETYLFVLIER